MKLGIFIVAVSIVTELCAISFAPLNSELVAIVSGSFVGTFCAPFVATYLINKAKRH